MELEVKSKIENRGRDTVITELVLRKLELALMSGLTIKQACYQANIAESTYHYQKVRNDDFSERIECARDLINNLARKQVVKAIANGDTKTAKWWLEKRDREFQTRFLEENTKNQEAEKLVIMLASDTLEAQDSAGNSVLK